MFRQFFRCLINAPKVIVTEPVTKTTLRRPATAERNARGEKARERYIEIAAALKAEAGITLHTAHKKMNVQAWMDTGHILAPAGTTRRQLYILARCPPARALPGVAGPLRLRRSWRLLRGSSAPS
jgi:hypothetical protein